MKASEFDDKFDAARKGAIVALLCKVRGYPCKSS